MSPDKESWAKGMRNLRRMNIVHAYENGPRTDVYRRSEVKVPRQRVQCFVQSCHLVDRLNTGRTHVVSLSLFDGTSAGSTPELIQLGLKNLLLPSNSTRIMKLYIHPSIKYV